MKTGIACFSFFLSIFLLLGSSARAAEVRHYILYQGDDQVRVQITWKNLQGNDTISGLMFFQAGEMTFAGDNPRPGYLWWRDENGILTELSKLTKGSSFEWVGKTYYDGFAANARLVPAARPKMPSTTTTKPSGNATVRQYAATMGGAGFSATLNWHNIQGLGDIDGHFTWDGNRTSFSGKNPSSGYIWLRDTDGNRYELWKSKTNSGKVRWAGSATTPSGQSHSFSMTSR